MLANYKRTLELQTEAIEQQAERLDVVEFKVEINFIYSLVCFLLLMAMHSTISEARTVQ